MAEAAFEGGGCGEVLSIPTLDALLKTLPKLMTGDTILVKASHAMHFEESSGEASDLIRQMEKIHGPAG